MTLLEQGKVQRTDTTIDLANWQAAPTVSTVGTPVDRLLHNSNQIIRATLTQPQPDYAQVKTGASVSSLTASDMPELIDGIKSSIAYTPSNIYFLTIGYTNTPTPVITSAVYFYSKFPFSDTTKIKLYSSYIPDEVGFSLISSVTYSVTFDNINDVYQYTATFATPQKFNYLRIRKHGTDTTSSETITEKITEIQAKLPRVPTVKYWFFGSSTETNGAEGVVKELPTNTLDIAYDLDNDRFYALVFKDTDGTSVPFDDDFTEIAGTSQFDTQRWDVDPSSIFTRDVFEDRVVFDASTGFGKMTSQFTLESDFDTEIYYEATEVVSSGTSGYFRIIDENENVIASSGISYSNLVSSGTYHALYVTNLKNFTQGGLLTRLTPKQNTAVSQTWKVNHQGSNVWTVSGTVSGLQGSTATTGVTYNGTQFNFFIASTEPHAEGESFEFDVVNTQVYRIATSGTLSISRSVNTLQFTADDITGTVSIGTDSYTEVDAPVKVQLYAETNGTSAEIHFDDFVVNTGVGSYPGVPSFTIKRLNPEGLSDGSDLIGTLDVINDGTKGYNDYLNGSVALAHLNGKVYVKIEDKLMRFADTASISFSDGTTDITNGHAEVATEGEVPVRDISSFSVITMNVNPASGSEDGPSDVVVYQYSNPDTNQIEIRTVTTSGLVSDVTNRLLIIDDSQITSSNRNFFWNINDLNTMYFVEDNGSLYYYNTDDRLVGFVNVNFSDPNLPAGVGAQTDVLVTVANLWGTPLAGKTVSLSVTSGDGSISPSSALTNSEGLVDDPSVPQFTAGSTTGITTVKATVNQ